MQKLKLGIIANITKATHPVRVGEGLDRCSLTVEFIFLITIFVSGKDLKHACVG